MKTQINKILIAVSALSLLTIGCGDLPEDPQQVYSMDQENLTSMTDQDRNYVDYNLTEAQANPQFNVRIFDEEEEETIIEAWDDSAAEPVVLPLWNEAEEEQSDEFSPMPAGFADGCASSDEWSRLATAVCNSYEAEVGQTIVGDGCGQGQYRLTNFSCITAGDQKTESARQEFTSVLLGDETTCKTAEHFQTTAVDVCGTASEVIEMKGLTACDIGDDNSGPHYQSVRVTCIAAN